ncbi:AGC family protein kinase [Tritrichomonas foetus]|uniref:AGC family protein kinase n=1 Tax=Tritrichomonas foetus TaxID=1144522 RepID=A0A1J4L082_9EUKA|nr:AGC family protein kinase [Tritrichomonas foetus]|eukprot:OHT15340.1 AGC family protein kinase [Tritrichomonas foetus]
MPDENRELRSDRTYRHRRLLLRLQMCLSPRGCYSLFISERIGKTPKNLNLTNKLTSNLPNNFCAIKVVPKSRVLSPDDKDKLFREVRSMKMLNHDNIVSLHDFFENDSFYFIVIDYCEGGTIFDYIMKGNQLREPQAATIFKQIVDAIEYCHKKGIAHRDIKPQNILLTDFPHVKISDFGLCGIIQDNQKMNTFCGSPCYCAPECLCRVSYDGKIADVWSLGVVLFELVTFSHPWNVNNVSQMINQIKKAEYTIPPHVTSACADLIEMMLISDTSQRATIDEVLAHPWLKLVQRRFLPKKPVLPTLKSAIVDSPNDASLPNHSKQPIESESPMNSAGSDDRVHAITGMNPNIHNKLANSALSNLNKGNIHQIGSQKSCQITTLNPPLKCLKPSIVAASNITPNVASTTANSGIVGIGSNIVRAAGCPRISSNHPIRNKLSFTDAFDTPAAAINQNVSCKQPTRFTTAVKSDDSMEVNEPLRATPNAKLLGCSPDYQNFSDVSCIVNHSILKNAPAVMKKRTPMELRCAENLPQGKKLFRIAKHDSLSNF